MSKQIEPPPPPVHSSTPPIAITSQLAARRPSQRTSPAIFIIAAAAILLPLAIGLVIAATIIGRGNPIAVVTGTPEQRAVRAWLKENTHSGQWEEVRWWPARNMVEHRQEEMDEIAGNLKWSEEWLKKAEAELGKPLPTTIDEHSIEYADAFNDARLNASRPSGMLDPKYFQELGRQAASQGLKRLRNRIQNERLKDAEHARSRVADDRKQLSTVRNRPVLRILRLKYRTTTPLGKVIHSDHFVVESGKARPATEYERTWIVDDHFPD